MKSLIIILAALMAFMVGGVSATLDERDTMEFGRLMNELSIRGVPGDLIDSVYAMMVKRNVDPDTTVTVCPSSAGVPPASVTETPPAASGTPTASAPGAPIPPVSGTPPTDTGLPPVASTEVPNTTGAATPPTTSAPVIESTPTSTGVAPPSGITPNETTVATGTTTHTSTTSASVSASSTPPAVNGGSMAKMNLAAIGVAAFAALY